MIGKKELAKKEFNQKYKDGPSDDFKKELDQSKEFLAKWRFSFEEIESVFWLGHVMIIVYVIRGISKKI